MIEALFKGIMLGLLLSISVGPVIFSILKQSLNNGYKGGISFVAGVSLSDIALVVVSNFFTELFGSLNEHRTTIGLAGSCFLITVGLYFIFFKKVKVDAQGQHVFKFRRRDYVRIALSGFIMNTLNPGVLIFWLTTCTAFIDQSTEQRIIIFTTCLLLVLAGDLLKVFLAGKIRRRLTPKNLRLVNRLNGVVLVGFGIALVWGLIFYADKIK